MNTKAKGDKHELRCAKELEAEGWRVHRATKTRFHPHGVDIFGLYDVIGVHPTRGWILVQVKSNWCPPRVREAIRNHRVPIGTLKQAWVWVDRKGWKKIDLPFTEVK